MTNFISWQLTGDLLNNAALHFQRNFGYMEMASKRFAENFNGKIWGHNGPKRLTRDVPRVLQRHRAGKHAAT